MTEAPALPLLLIQHGPWKAEIFDPRPDPLALGARYVHGGYIASFSHHDLCLTSQPHPAWNPYQGCGFPEVFEWPLGVGFARPGEELLRIGAGRIRQQDATGMPGSNVPLCSSLLWNLEEHSQNQIIMTAEDELRYGPDTLGYRIQRRVRLDGEGLLSETTLTLSVPWNVPLAWFAHPFVRQAQGDGTRFFLPEGAQIMEPEPHPAADYRFRKEGGLVNVTGLWGSRSPLQIECDPACGGGILSITLDRPLDHLVLFATDTAASPEPQLVRAWKNGEQNHWSIRYGWNASESAEEPPQAD